MKLFFKYLTILFCFGSLAVESVFEEEVKVVSEGRFSGRVSSFDTTAKLIKFKVNFENLKYVNKFDEVLLWGLHQERLKCRAKVIGKSSDYLLLKIANFKSCNDRSNFTIGRYYNFFSQDLVNNLRMGKELVEILIKKRLALKGKIVNNKKLVDTYLQRVEALNKRYDVLRSKLEVEWREELAKMEGDHQDILRNTEGLKIRLNEVNHKLEKYRIEDNNLTKDRWSLDPTLHYLK